MNTFSIPVASALCASPTGSRALTRHTKASIARGASRRVVRTTALGDVAGAQVVLQLAEMAPEQASLIKSIASPLISIGELAFIVRIVMTWYPNIKDDEFPWSIVYRPTEPLLGPTRRVIQPVGGVDVSPIVWFALLSFANEILLGRQGLLVMLEEKAAVLPPL